MSIVHAHTHKYLHRSDKVKADRRVVHVADGTQVAGALDRILKKSGMHSVLFSIWSTVLVRGECGLSERQEERDAWLFELKGLVGGLRGIETE